jgi:pyruvate formate-lyase/glycerol dehydratase family glycyl radical enzyme
MKQRIAKLRDKSLAAEATLSAERAVLLTRFYQSGAAHGQPVVVARAMAFRYLMQHKDIPVDDGELIVGERGPAAKATPTYPEICIHSEADLQLLHEREKISFASDDETRRQLLEDVSPFWQGQTMRERILAGMSDAWKAAYEAGVFTEFMEQRAPGHTVLGDKIYKLGLNDLRGEIATLRAGLDRYCDDEALAKDEQLQAMDIAAEALLIYASRYAEKLAQLAAACEDIERRQELEKMAANCRVVPAHKPENFWQALQYYWFVHLGVITELNTWDSFNPGRLDQHLQPFFTRETGLGTLDRERAKELLQALWVKFNNQPAPPKVGVTAKESNTYTDFALINLGGVDANGHDAVNEMSFLILEVIEEMRLLQPSSMVQVSKKNDDALLMRALEIIATGYGQPSLFNTDAIIQEMLRVGKDIIDARNGGASGCVETGAFGTESYILTGYFNLVKILELTLHNGRDPLSGRQLGPETGSAVEFRTYAQLFEAFTIQLQHFIDLKIAGNRIIEQLYARYLPAPFLSLFIDDCLANARDYNAGGARYNTAYVQGVGLGTVTDSLAAIAYNVFEQEFITLPDFIRAMQADFKNHDDLSWRLNNLTPKYGNDDMRADRILSDVFEAFFSAVDGRPNSKGGSYHINLLPTTSHVYFGSKVGATPDGRLAGTPLSEGISPVQGMDGKGPTAVINSAARIDHVRTGGTLLNQKFLPSDMASREDRAKIAALVRTYFRQDGHHIQFNVVAAETLRQAQENPAAHRDLIVRVAGYSDYFVDLTPELQAEIIRRTEQSF